MKINRAELKQGIYSWNCNITKDEWVSILKEDSLIRQASKSVIYKFYLEPMHRSTCNEVGVKYNIDPQIIKENIVALGKAVQKKLNRFEIIGTDKSPTYWVIPMYGELNNRVVEWVVRPELIAAMEELYLNGNPSQEKYKKENKTFRQSDEDRSKTNFSVEDYIDLLKVNKNLVLTGILGTGKTYLAKKIAEKMQAQSKLVRFHATYSNLDFIGGVNQYTGEYNSNFPNQSEDGDFTGFCKTALQNLIDSQKTIEELKQEKTIYKGINLFLETIKNEIFTNGQYLLKNVINQGNIAITDVNKFEFTITNIRGESLTISMGDLYYIFKAYKRSKITNWSLSEVESHLGIFKDHQICLHLLREVDEFLENTKVEVNVETVKRMDFVFIIDEMNKADFTKVLGEVSPSIDPNARGVKGKTKIKHANPLPKYDLFYDGFYVPENVYIIGTVNDVDTKNKNIDFDVVSKFAWKEIKATDRLSMWDDLIPEYKDDAYNIMTIINNKIDSIPGLNHLYHVGPSYFLKLKNFDGDFELFWDNYLEGILTRYLLNLPNHSEIIAQLKDACQNGKNLIAV